MVVEAGESTVCIVVSRLQAQSRVGTAVQVQRQLAAESPLARDGRLLFRSGRQLIGRGPPVLGNLLCSASPDLNVTLVQKQPQRNIQNNV